MFKKFKTKELIFLTLVGALMFVFDFAISSGIDSATGINGVGYIVSGFIFVALGVIGAYTIKKFGSIAILGLIYGLLITPTQILGPPSPFKIVLGLLVGIIADLVVLAFRYKKFGYYLSFTIGNLITLPAWIGIMILFGLPKVDEVISMIWIIALVYFIQGIFGAWIGIKLYEKKLSKTKIIKQISG